MPKKSSTVLATSSAVLTIRKSGGWPTRKGSNSKPTCQQRLIVLLICGHSSPQTWNPNP
jgi:hypothetical protein